MLKPFFLSITLACLLLNFHLHAQEAGISCTDSLVLQNIQLPEGCVFNYSSKKTLRDGHILFAANSTYNQKKGCLLVVCDKEGNFLQAFEYNLKGSTGKMRMEKIWEDALGNIIIAGNNNLDDDYLPPFVLKLSPQFNIIWCKKFNSLTSQFDRIVPKAISADSDGNIYVNALYYLFNDEENYGNAFFSLSGNGAVQWSAGYKADHLNYLEGQYCMDKLLIAGNHIYFFLPDFLGFLPLIMGMAKATDPD